MLAIHGFASVICLTEGSRSGVSRRLWPTSGMYRFAVAMCIRGEFLIQHSCAGYQNPKCDLCLRVLRGRWKGELLGYTVCRAHVMEGHDRRPVNLPFGGSRIHQVFG